MSVRESELSDKLTLMFVKHLVLSFFPGKYVKKMLLHLLEETHGDSKLFIIIYLVTWIPLFKPLCSFLP